MFISFLLGFVTCLFTVIGSHILLTHPDQPMFFSGWFLAALFCTVLWMAHGFISRRRPPGNTIKS
jgi:hypothetical protein